MNSERDNPDSEAADKISLYKVGRHPAHLIRRVHQRGVQLFNSAVFLENLTASQFAALATLLEAGPMPQSRLGRLASMDPSTISVVVRKLLSEKLVEKTKLPSDRRTSVIALTERGRRCAEQHVPISIRAGEDLLAALSEGERILLLELLDKITPLED